MTRQRHRGAGFSDGVTGGCRREDAPACSPTTGHPPPQTRSPSSPQRLRGNRRRSCFAIARSCRRVRFVSPCGGDAVSGPFVTTRMARAGAAPGQRTTDGTHSPSRLCARPSASLWAARAFQSASGVASPPWPDRTACGTKRERGAVRFRVSRGEIRNSVMPWETLPKVAASTSTNCSPRACLTLFSMASIFASSSSTFGAPSGPAATTTREADRLALREDEAGKVRGCVRKSTVSRAASDTDTQPSQKADARSSEKASTEELCTLGCEIVRAYGCPCEQTRVERCGRVFEQRRS